MSQPIFLMSPPRRDWTLKGRANFRSSGASPVNPGAARREWASLADAIVEAGGDVVVLPPNPRKNLTGLIYTAEAGEYVDGDEPVFLLPEMSAEHRRDEADWIGGFFEGLGIPTRAVRSTWEAQGDAIRCKQGRGIVHTFGTGKFSRTSQAAYSEVARLLSDEHIQLHFKADPWFHGNTFLNIYQAPRKRVRIAEPSTTPEVVIVCEKALLPGEVARLKRFVGEDARWVPISRGESMGYDTNALQVADTVLASDTMSSTTLDALGSVGFTVEKLDLSELFLKGGGAPVCLTNRLWGATFDRFPRRVLWSERPSIEAHTSM